MEIKQLKRFFFCLYFNPVLRRNSFTTSVLQMYIVGNLVQQNSTCILYSVTSHFGYVELWITRSIFFIPLDFEITRLTCMSVLDMQNSKVTLDNDALNIINFTYAMILF